MGGGPPTSVAGYPKRGAGFFLPGVWGCPPIQTSPKIGGYRGLIRDSLTSYSWIFHKGEINMSNIHKGGEI